MIFTKFHGKITVFFIEFFLLRVKGEEYENRTYAGKEISIYLHPYTVFLNPVGCTGALVHEEWILSAGHCFIGQDVSKLYAALGASDRKRPRYVIKVDTVHFNPKFGKVKEITDSAVMARYDLAMVKLVRPVTLAKDVQILEIEKQPWPNHPRLCTLTGYGANVYNDTKLHTSQFYFSTNCSCISDARILCANFVETGDSPCYGDSGGVVVCDGKGAAITSRGIPHVYCTDKAQVKKKKGGQLCGQSDFFYVFTLIRPNFSWLSDMTNKGASKLTNKWLPFSFLQISLQMPALSTALTYLSG